MRIDPKTKYHLVLLDTWGIFVGIRRCHLHHKCDCSLVRDIPCDKRTAHGLFQMHPDGRHTADYFGLRSQYWLSQCFRSRSVPYPRWAVQPLASSPLVVFFPTVVESHLGFLVQGPYRTTPSRDNIPPGELWNQHLVKETASLLVEAMIWLRDKAMLDVSALRCLPLDREKFPQGSRFAPMFDAVRQAFQDELLLLTFDGNYVTANQAKLARTQELRELFSPEQVAALFGSDIASWLSGDITQDKAPEILKYLMHELGIDLITPIKLVPILTKTFLEEQQDDWVLRLYEFLSGQEAALRRRLDTIPLIRLENGMHVVAHEDGEAKAFLPSVITTGFPTVRRSVCATPEARAFLSSLRITEPDPVDDVIRNVLPKYRQETVDVNEEAYTTDIERIRAAFNTDSGIQKEKLRSTLRDTNFVMVVDTGDDTAYVAKPGEVYIATDRLQQLFAGVPDILIVDNEYDCLRGEDIRDLLVSCGASRYLFPQAIPSGLGHSEKAQIRREAGLERASWENPPEDFTLRGLAQLMDFLPTLKTDEAAATRLGIINPPSEPEPSTDAGPVIDAPSDSDVYGDAKDLYGDDMPDIPPGTPDPGGGDDPSSGAGHGNQGRRGTQSGSGKGNGGAGGSGGHGTSGSKGNGNGGGPGKRTPGQTGGRPFISYVGAHPDDDSPDPDGLDQVVRMQIEGRAIDLIIGLEPALCRTSDGNPGFDLYEANSSGQPIRWVEVKSMTGSLEDRPVGLSHTQFECARKRGAAYWLYVVEYATDRAKARVLRIQDPIAHARTFTFDRGWAEIAQTEPPA